MISFIESIKRAVTTVSYKAIRLLNSVEDQELEARISHDSSCMEYRLSSYSIQVVNELDTISKALEDRRAAANELNKKLDE